MLRIEPEEKRLALQSALESYFKFHEFLNQQGTFEVDNATFQQLVRAVFAIIPGRLGEPKAKFNVHYTNVHLREFQSFYLDEGDIPTNIGYPAIANSSSIQFRHEAQSIFLNPLLQCYPEKAEAPAYRALWTLIPVIFARELEDNPVSTSELEKDILNFVKTYPMFVGEFDNNNSLTVATEETSNTPENEAHLSQANVVGSAPQIWLIGTGNTNEDFWPMFAEEAICGLGYSAEFNPLVNSSLAELAQVIEASDYERSPVELARQIRLFALDMQPGDYVFAKLGETTIKGFGIVVGAYRLNTDGDLAHIRRVDWRITEPFTVNKETKLWRRTVNILSSSNPALARNLLKTAMHMLETSPKLGMREFSNAESTSSQTSPAIQSVAPTADTTSGYWWINANPKRWNPLTDTDNGETIEFTYLNENKRPRRVAAHFHNVKLNDKVIAYATSPVKQVVAEFTIVQDLGPLQSGSGDGIVLKKLKNLNQPVEISTLEHVAEFEDADPIKNRQGTLFQLSELQYQHICDLAALPSSTLQSSVKYSPETAMKDLFVSRQIFDSIIESLQHKKNIILQGPPGVGKTMMAKRLAYSIIGHKADDHIEFVQFHQSYGYEEFIQGYRPNSSGSFVLHEGVFLRFVKLAHQFPEENFVFIIDEINRGNLSRILGECMLLIEADKRDKKHAIGLMHKGEQGPKFWIPQNLHIIGMMNTADRSLSMVDYALRRRFAFHSLEPQFQSEGFKAALKGAGMQDEAITSLCDQMQAVNKIIAAEVRLGKQWCIGHSYFCRDTSEKQIDWTKRLKHIVKHELLPLVYAYMPDSSQKRDKLVKEINKIKI